MRRRSYLLGGGQSLALCAVALRRQYGWTPPKRYSLVQGLGPQGPLERRLCAQTCTREFSLSVRRLTCFAVIAADWIERTLPQRSYQVP